VYFFTNLYTYCEILVRRCCGIRGGGTLCTLATLEKALFLAALGYGGAGWQEGPGEVPEVLPLLPLTQGGGTLGTRLASTGPLWNK
jgi:hypothetical protein